ncbi:MAG: GntR family transcriptional regulator [Clostridiales bacterium]|nr:GntR family transcriptional regulator [Clostridiales bacterium]
MDDLLYRRIAKTLEDGILSGAYRDGDPVPSTNQFARLYAINPATAARGVNELVEAGILYKKRGLGMYVCEGAREKLLEARRKQFERETLKTFLQEAGRLNISRETLVQWIEDYREEDINGDGTGA